MISVEYQTNEIKDYIESIIVANTLNGEYDLGDEYGDGIYRVKVEKIDSKIEIRCLRNTILEFIVYILSESEFQISAYGWNAFLRIDSKDSRDYRQILDIDQVYEKINLMMGVST